VEVAAEVEVTAAEVEVGVADAVVATNTGGSDGVGAAVEARLYALSHTIDVWETRAALRCANAQPLMGLPPLNDALVKAWLSKVS
jgi:hypothetical protein